MRKIKRTFCANTVIDRKIQIHNLWQAAAKGQNIILGERHGENSAPKTVYNGLNGLHGIVLNDGSPPFHRQTNG